MRRRHRPPLKNYLNSIFRNRAPVLSGVEREGIAADTAVSSRAAAEAAVRAPRDQRGRDQAGRG
ncbi:hypothetical protein AB0G02_41125, partial [Actinosynnema sp. NPDC023658]|uniref:hypothetical protein n=1 Tax=Actinosynnema sp. NPDC023658 TaxID=3155465 RepID=UPI0033E471E1